MESRSEFKPRILHLSAYYSGSPVYAHLVEALARKGVVQKVYAAVRTRREVGKNPVSHPNVELQYDLVLNKSDRFFFRKKMRKIWRRIQTMFDLKEVDMIHAHTLFSDGVGALKAYQKHQIPYIIAVRNTDINIFWKYFPHLRPLGKKVLKNASQIVFINQSYRDTLLQKLSVGQQRSVKEKSVIIPNGVSSFWLSTQCKPKIYAGDSLSFIYVGDYSVNKNVPLVIDVLKYIALKKGGLPVQLNLIGGGSARGRSEIDSKIAQAMKQNKLPNLEIIEHGRVSSKEALAKLYRSSDFFIMLSKRETFGLVYIEAMSQGTPIIYTEGQGVSSFFEKFEVGIPVTLKEVSFSTILENIEGALEDYSSISENCIVKAQSFDWQDIADQYLKVYHKKVE